MTRSAPSRNGGLLLPALVTFLLCASPSIAGASDPTCMRHFDAAGSTAEIQGLLAASPEVTQGLQDVRLADGARNLVLKRDVPNATPRRGR